MRSRNKFHWQAVLQSGVLLTDKRPVGEEPELTVAGGRALVYMCRTGRERVMHILGCDQCLILLSTYNTGLVLGSRLYLPAGVRSISAKLMRAFKAAFAGQERRAYDNEVIRATKSLSYILGAGCFLLTTRLAPLPQIPAALKKEVIDKISCLELIKSGACGPGPGHSGPFPPPTPKLYLRCPSAGPPTRQPGRLAHSSGPTPGHGPLMKQPTLE